MLREKTNATALAGLHSIVSVARKSCASVRRFFWTSINKMRVSECGPGLTVNYKSKLTASTALGTNVNFNGMTVSGAGKVTIGDNFHSGHHCQIITSFHDYDNGDAIPYGDAMIDKDVWIGDNVWLGNNVIILGGSWIGEGAIIQAGSVVCGRIPECGIAGGHPAKVFKYRDIQHYERLKCGGNFH